MKLWINLDVLFLDEKSVGRGQQKRESKNDKKFHRTVINRTSIYLFIIFISLFLLFFHRTNSHVYVVYGGSLMVPYE